MKKLLLTFFTTTLFVFGVKSQTTLISPTGDGGFETGGTFAANSWNVSNGTQVNQWVVSNNATAGFSGLNCAYVSNSYSTTTTHSYVITSTSNVHFYRDITVPAGETNIQLSFNWICQGESVAWDRMRIWLVPTTYTPTAGTQITATGTAPSGRIQAGLTNYNLQSTWATANVTIPPAYAGTSFRLVFEWRNDGSGGAMPPAGIDDISLTSSPCGAAPTALNTSTVLSSSASFTWAPNGNETAWDIYYGAQPLSLPNATTVPTATSSVASYSATGLTQLTPYSVYVRANCGGGVYGFWSAVKNFTTTTTCPFPTNLTISAVGQTSAVATWTAGASETSWLISYSAPTTTVIASTTPSFTLTGLNPGTAYSVKVQGICGAGDSSIFTNSKTFYTPCLPPNITSTTPSVRCGIGTATLSATADPGASINWYDSSTGGMPIATGSLLTTPTLTATTDFYVSAVGPASPGSGGRFAPTGTSATTPSNYGLVFNATKSFTLNTVDVYPTGAAGTLVINLTDNTGAVLQTTTAALATGTVGVPQTINLNFSVPIGTGYRLIAASGPTMIRESSLGGFPYAIGSVGSITSGYISGTSTTYYYFYNWVFSTGCESALTAVTASVTLPDAVTATSTSTNLCTAGINTATLTAVQSGTTNAYSYTWTATPAAGSGMPTSVTGATTTISPTQPGSYTYDLAASDGVCNTVSSITVMLNNIPDIYATISPTVVCSGEAVTLNAINASVASPSASIGTGTTSTTAEPNPYYTTYWGNKNQYLIRASELTAAGYIAGNLTSLGIDLGGATTTLPLTNFYISIGNTALTALPATFQTGLTTVYSDPSYTLVPNSINTHVFTTPFYWDGVSNIVIETCFNNSNWNGSQTITYTNPGFVSALYYRADNATVCSAPGAPTTSSNRPNLILGGLRAIMGSGTIDWQWNPGAINSNTAVVNPVNTGSVAATQVYTVTATNTAGACSNTATVSVLVNPLPTAPVVTNNTQCGVGVPTASVNGGTNYNWYATPTSTTALQSGSSTNYTTSISSTTTWYVSAFDGTCESPRVAVTQSVTIPDAITASSTATTLCMGGANTITLTATQTGTVGNAYVFTWTATPASGSGIPTSMNGSSVSVTPTLPNVYTYDVFATDGVCNATSSVSVTLNELPSINAMATPTVICSGDNVNLFAESINAAAGTATVGVQTTTGTFGTPYRQSAGTTADLKVQYLYTKAELNAAGIFYGNITELRFNATTAGSGQIDNFVIKMGSTTAAANTTTYNTSATTLVYGPYSYSVSLGQNVHTFDTPFYWDGVSNVIIEICHDAVNPTGTSSSVSMQSASNRTIYSGTTGACNLTTGTNTTLRPVIGFGAQAGTNVTSSMDFVWNPGAINTNTALVNPVNTGSVAATQVYTATVTNTVTGCVNSTTVGVFVNPLPTAPIAFDNTQCGIGVPTASVSGGTSYLWYASPTSTTVLQAGTSANFTTSISSTTTWYVSSFSAAGCESSTRTALTQTVTPPPTLTLNAPSAICAATGIGTFSVSSPAGNYNSYVWSPLTDLYSDAAATVPYTGGNANTVYVKSTTAGVITVTVNAMDSGSGCATVESTSITINSGPISLTVSATPSLACSGSTLGLSATASSGPPVNVFSENFNAATNAWTTINNSTGGTPASAAWTLHNSPYTSGVGTNITSNDASQFYLVDSDSQGSGSTTDVLLQSPVIDASAVTTLNLNFRHFYNYWNSSDAAKVEVSTNGTVWTTVQNYSTGGTDVGTATNFSNANINLDAYAGNSTLYIRFNYSASWGYGWAIDNVNLTGAANYNYSWISSPAGFTSSVQNPTLTASTSATYSVTVTLPATGCSLEGSTSVTVNPTPTVSAVGSSSAICSGNSATLTASGATNYTWAPSGDVTATSVVTPTASVTYTVTGESLGCAATATVDLVVNVTPTVTATSSSSVICSGGANTVTLTAVSTNSTYAWAPSGGTSDNEVVSPSANTVYTVTSDNAGCVATATVAIDVNPTPTVTAVASNTAFCSGTTVTLTASGATNYTWMPNGDLTAVSMVTPGSSTTYTVSGESLGCTATATVDLIVTQTPTVTASASPTAICLGNSAALTAVSSTANYSWSPAGGTADVAIVSPSSNTTYTVTSVNGSCVGTATVDLAVISAPSITVSPSSAVTCSGSSVTLTASGADTYTWSSGGGNAAIAVFTPTAMTTYTVDGSNLCGNGTATVSVGVDSPVTLSASTSATMICLSIESATLSVTGTATNFTWSPGGQTTANVVVSPTVTTIYTVTASNACGVVTSTVTQNVQDCTGIEELFAAGMNVYPNPATDVVNFSIPAHLVGQVKLEIYDALGKVVALEELTKEVTSLRITKFDAGVYIFKLINNNGDVKIGRLIKQ